MRQRIFTLRQIIEEGTAVLEAAGIEEAALDAWYLLEYTAGISRASYYGDPGRILEERQATLNILRCGAGGFPCSTLRGSRSSWDTPSM